MTTDQHETQPLLDKKTDDYSTDVKDLPPPGYSFTSSDNDAPSTPTPAVNGLNISARCGYEITGSYELDPALPLVETKRRGCHKHRDETPPTVNFKAHHGNIATKLAVTGDALNANRATMRATSRTGDILIDITEKSSRRSLDVETWTRRGNTIVLLPPNFLGAVSLNTGRGRLIQLPGLEGRTSVLRSSSRESTFLVGPVLESVMADVKGIDYVRLSSKKGGIAVGFSDVDGEPQMLENVRKELSARHGHGRGCC